MFFTPPVGAVETGLTSLRTATVPDECRKHVKELLCVPTLQVGPHGGDLGHIRYIHHYSNVALLPQMNGLCRLAGLRPLVLFTHHRDDGLGIWRQDGFSLRAYDIAEVIKRGFTPVGIGAQEV